MCRSKSEGGQRCDADEPEDRKDDKRRYQRERYAARMEIVQRVMNTDVSPEQKMSKDEAIKYARHVMRIDSRLVKAKKGGLDTEDRYTYKTNNGAVHWLPERKALHNEIITQLMKKNAQVPRERQALMSGGLGGAGKGHVLKGYTEYDVNRYATVNPDDIKEIMADMGMIPEVEGLSPMEASPLVHEEASYLSKRYADGLVERGTNIIYDITMSSESSTIKKLDLMHDNGYEVDAVFVDIDPDESVQRAQKRHLTGFLRHKRGEGHGGRWLPPSITEGQKIHATPKVHRSVNAMVYEGLVRLNAFRHHQVYDNNTTGSAPIHLDSVRKDEGWD